MVLNETHLQEEEITIPGYTVFRKDRSSNSGGIMIALKDIMKNIAIEVARMDGIHEGLWIVINNTIVTLKIGVLYLPQEGTKKSDLKKYI